MSQSLNCILISPGFPGEMPFFARGLAEVGVQVIGIGDQPVEALPSMARDALAHYERIPRLWDEEETVRVVRGLAERVRIDQVECVWEPGMILAARLREALGLPGLDVAATVPFRDKEEMKRVLDAAGIRTPRHARATSEAEVRAAAETVGYPLIVKPIAGAGSADTHRVGNPGELDAVLPLIAHVPVVSVEEFIDGEEFTYDTICADGNILHENISWYRPKPLIARTVEWISPQTVVLRDPFKPELAAGRAMGHAVIDALGFRSGFTHMEWFLKPDGEAVFGEIGARPPGARTVDLMNFSCDADLFTAWAEAVCHGRITQTIHRRYNAALICKRAEGQGRIRAVEGLQGLLHSLGDAVVGMELLPVGAPRRDWKQTLLSDGHLFVRHPDLQTLLAMADRVGTDLRIYAG